MQHLRSAAWLAPALAGFACTASSGAAAEDGGAGPAAADAGTAADGTDAAPPPAAALPPHVRALWAAGDGDVVEQDATDAPPAPDTAPWAVWDGSRVRLFAARNEIVAFQLIVRAAAGGIGSLRAALPRLQRRGGGDVIAYAPPGADPTDDRGRPIQLFSINYMNVTQATHADWIYPPGAPAAPADPLGWKPVQIVPENARAGRGGFPLAVAPARNQAIWIEVYTGRDRPAGLYDGAVTVTADGAAVDVPVELTLLDFALPDTNSMHAMVYFEEDQVSLYQGQPLTAAFHRFAHRHRIELVNGYDAAAVGAVPGRFDGGDFSAAAGYDGPGAGQGNVIVPASFYGPDESYADRATAWSKSDAWMTFLDRAVPGAITFMYMYDEPSSSQFAAIRNIADNIHTNPGPGRRLPVFVTHGYTSGLDGAIDIWCSGPWAYDIARAEAERAKGHRFWTYNGGRPAGPAIVIDAPATEARVVAWAAFRHGIDVWFYWHGDHWRHNSQKKVGDRRQDVWGNPITFDQRDASGAGDFANGDGVLLYPGEEVIHPEQDRGLPGPVASVQLANLRRGLQDHQYLALARARGRGDVADAAAAAIAPAVFSDAGQTVSFPQSGARFEEARYRLAQAIVTSSASGSQ